MGYMKFSELHRRLERAGWYIVKETDHRYYGHDNYPHLIKVGRHGSKEIPPNEFYKVLKAAGLK
jgi:predicted RNA binding protein YcfA (HicA-like mRNA interferase family)